LAAVGPIGDGFGDAAVPVDSLYVAF
jgi:hypothetical protein